METSDVFSGTNSAFYPKKCIIYYEMTEQVAHPTKARTAVAVILFLLGSAGIFLYTVSAFLYPVLNSHEFSALASYNDMQQVLMNRYLGHLAYLIVGLASAIAGIWLYFGKRQIANESNVFAS